MGDLKRLVWKASHFLLSYYFIFCFPERSNSFSHFSSFPSPNQPIFICLTSISSLFLPLTASPWENAIRCWPSGEAQLCDRASARTQRGYLTFSSIPSPYYFLFPSSCQPISIPPSLPVPSFFHSASNQQPVLSYIYYFIYIPLFSTLGYKAAYIIFSILPSQQPC